MFGKVLFRRAREMGIDPVAAVRMRARYLIQEIDACLESTIHEDLVSIILEDDFDEMFYLLNKIKKKEISMQEQITDDDIALAKEHPIENLVELDEKGKMMAWCHPDTKPSMTLWRGKNKLRCWACSKTYNPIDVLVDRDGMTFIEAVKRLSQ